jgi:CopG family transcriptional regulator/antitoxin EndoAI
MKTPPAAVCRRLNITLPEDAVRLIDRVAGKAERSRLIADAIRHYVRRTDRATLRKRLREGAARRAQRDRQLARDWFFADEEGWHTAQRASAW